MILDSFSHAFTSLAVLGAAGIATYKGFRSLAGEAEAVPSSARKSEIRDFLVGINVNRRLGELPRQFTYLFDAVFGTRQASWKCYLRSALVSTVVVVVLSCVFLGTMYPVLDTVLFQALPTYVFYFVILFLVNINVDFLSLFETRWLIGRISPQASAASVSAWLVLDLFFTISIYLSVMVTFLYFHGILFGHLPSPSWSHFLAYAVNAVVDTYREIIPPNPDSCYSSCGECRPYMRIGHNVSFFSTLFTSMWLWSYMVTIGLFRARQRLAESFTWLTATFDIAQKPVSVLGFWIGWVACFAVWTVGGLVLLFSAWLR